MPNYLLERDTIHGASGKAFITQDGVVKEIFAAKKIEAKGNISESDMKVIGTKKIQIKKGGVKMTGSGTMYYVTSDFAKMLVDYLHTGVLAYFNMQVSIDDEASSVGTHTVALYNCQLTGDIPLFILDDGSDMLTFDFSFTFEDAEILSSFNHPAQLGD